MESKKRIVVVGDLMLDLYEIGEATRISPEAPVPVILNPSVVDSLGGAANVAHAISHLGVEVMLFGHIARDSYGKRIVEIASSSGIDVRASPSLQKTSVKRRLFANSNQIGRVDTEGNLVSNQSFPDLQKCIRNCDILVISDYGKSMGLEIEKARATAQSLGVPFIVDPKGSDLSNYCGAFLLKPNRREFERLFGLGIGEVDQISKVLRRYKIENLLVTLGNEGAKLICSNGRVQFFAISRELPVFDVTGAGDIVIAGIATMLSFGLGLDEAIAASLNAAEKSVGEIGASMGLGAACQILKKANIPETDKLACLRKLSDERGQTIAWANGCFDLLHPGHLHLIEKARSTADFLVVGVNSDTSVKALKGPDRPVVGEQDRRTMLDSLRFTDWVTVFSEETPLNSILALKPDVIVKGGDYEASEVVGFHESKGWGGKVKIVPRVGSWSTSLMLESKNRSA